MATKVSVKLPAEPGVNTTVAVQVALMASAELLVQVCAETVKYGAVTPVKVIAGLPNVKGAVPVFLQVTTCPGEDVP